MAGPGEHRVRRTSPTSARATTRSRWSTSSAAATRLATLTLGQHARPAADSVPRASTGTCPPGINAIPGTAPELVRDEDAIDHDWGAGLAGAQDLDRPVRGALDADAEPRPRRLRVRRHGRRRRAAVRRRRAGHRQVDRPGRRPPTAHAAARRRSAHDRDGVLRERRRARRPGSPTPQVGDLPADAAYRARVLEHAGRRRAAEHPDPAARPRAQRRDARLRLGRRLARGRDHARSVRGPVDEDASTSPPASTGSAARTTTACGPSSTTCPWSTSGLGNAGLQRRQGRGGRHPRAARRVLRGRWRRARRRSTTSGSATSCRSTAATPPSTSPTGTSRAPGR